MEIANFILKISLKDWLIFCAAGLLILSFFEIKRLKKIVSSEAKKKLTPQLTLELNLEEMCLLIKNEWFFIARDITFEPLDIILNDSGYPVKFIMEIEGIDLLRPQERKQLGFKIYDKDHYFLKEVTEKFLPHLVSPSFKLQIMFRNVEGVQFHATLSKKGKVFLPERVELLQEAKKETDGAE